MRPRISLKLGLFVCCLFLLPSGLMAQIGDAKTLLKDGIALHDKGDYDGAIAKYEAALEIDPDNVLAWYELALSHQAKGDCSKAISVCKQTIAKHKKSDKLEGLYTLYGNCLDQTENTKEAIKVYKEGMKKAPDSYLLPFNMGVTYLRSSDMENAQKAFEKALTINPLHTSSHYYMAIVADQSGNRIPTILAMTHFLLLSPEGERANRFLPVLYQRMASNVTKNGENQITINIDANSLDEKEKENDFKAVELLLSFSSALAMEEGAEPLSNPEKLAKQFSMVFDVLNTDKKNKGFFWEHYAPFFVQLKAEGHVETLCNLINSGDEKEAEARTWVADNEAKVKAFYGWVASYYGG